MEGQFDAVYSSLDEELNQAHIALTLELSTFMEDGFEPEVPNAEVEVSRATKLQLELEGELIWDLDSGRLVSIELEGSVASNMIITETIRPDDAEQAPFEERVVTRDMTMEGTLSQSISIE